MVNSAQRVSVTDVNERIWDEGEFPARKLDPQAVISVFEDRKGLVKPADGLMNGPFDAETTGACMGEIRGIPQPLDPISLWIPQGPL